MKRGARNPDARQSPAGRGRPRSWRHTYRAWLDMRPPIVRVLGLRFRPNRWYRIKSTGQRCQVMSFAEDGTLTVDTTDRILGFHYGVFGLKPADLEPWPKGPSPTIGGAS
jgi:hypothetical protein